MLIYSFAIAQPNNLAFLKSFKNFIKPTLLKLFQDILKDV